MKSVIRKDELIYFILFAVVSVIPFWLVKYVPSLDGPTHLYNARLITELLKGNPFISQFFTLNPIVVGNSTAHFTLAFLMFICPAWLAEKIVLTAYILGLGLSFRYFVNSSFRSGSLLYLIIFPLGFNSLFLMGYYNFCIAFIPFFLTLGYILRNERHLGKKQFVTLALLFLCIFFSHAVVFVFTGLIIVIMFFVEAGYNIRVKSGVSKDWSGIVKKYLVLLGAAIPAIYFWMAYYLAIETKKPVPEVTGMEAFILTLNNLINLKFLVGFNHEMEDGPIILTMISLAALLLIILFRRRIKYVRPGKEEAGARYSKLLWGSIVLVLFFLIFLLPDHMTTGSITIRFSILLSILFIAWVSQYKLPKPIIHAALVLILGAFVWHRSVMLHYYKDLNKLIVDMEEVSREMKPNSTMFPINCTENWLEGHFHCYIGIDEPVVNILNPQSHGQMPVVWKFKKMPNVLLGKENLAIADIIWLPDRSIQNDVPVDYIFIIKPNRIAKTGQARELVNKINPYYTESSKSKKGNAEILSLKDEFRSP